MNFLEKTFLDWKVTLDPMAAKKPGQLKVASEAEAATTPPTMGTRDSSTGMLGVSPRKMLESSTEKKGSIDYSRPRLNPSKTGQILRTVDNILSNIGLGISASDP